jgi:lysyl-tRNA synthetase class 2
MGMNLRSILEARAAMEEAVRAYFDEEGFVEVTTQVVVRHPNLDPNVHPIPVTIRDFNDQPGKFWLHTSPELSMKKLLAMGSGDIFQIGPVFRDGERTRLHRCEFSMLEWYRIHANYEDAIRDTIRIVRAACRVVRGEEKAFFAGQEYDLAAPWEEMTMAEAFHHHAGVESWEADELREALEEEGCIVGPGSMVQDLFFQLYLEKVEPVLGVERPTIVRDYPAFLGTMAGSRADDPKILERFEVYIGGMELANGYTEFNDPVELGERMDTVLRDLERKGIQGLSVDEEFLEAMNRLPPCAGVSIGMDRLAMVVLDADDISQVVYPYEPETTKK